MHRNIESGSIHTCPSCGAVVDSFTGRCKECGYHFSDIDANLTTRKLQSELERVDRESGQNFVGSLFAGSGLDKNTNRKVQLIKNFAIPNTKADLIEFAMLCSTNLSSSATTQSEIILRKAWKAKGKEVAVKAKMLFPNDTEVSSALGHLSKEGNNFFKSNQKTLTIVGVFLVFALMIWGMSAIVRGSEEKTAAYATEMMQKIESLPTPDESNYKECYRKFNNIHWTESTHSNEYKAFVEAQVAYRDLLVGAYKEAGVSEDMIPASLNQIGKEESESSQNETEEGTLEDTVVEETIPESDSETAN